MKIVLGFLGSIDWIGIARRILEKMSGEVNEHFNTKSVPCTFITYMFVGTSSLSVKLCAGSKLIFYIFDVT